MKLFVLAAVLCSIFAVAFGAVKRPVDRYTTDEEANRYCNSLYPVSGVSWKKVIKMVANREPLGSPRDFGKKEWCNLHCILEQFGYYAPDGSMRIPFIMEAVLDLHPELAPSSGLIYLILLQIDGSTKDMTDECSKAFISHYRFIEALLLGYLSIELETEPYINGKIAKAFMSGKELPQELDAIIQKSVHSVESLFDKISKKQCL